MTYTQLGHLEQDYLSQDYMSGRVFEQRGFQFLVEIKDKTKTNGIQFSGDITKTKSEALQFVTEIDQKKSEGVQFLSLIEDKEKTSAAQFQTVIADTKAAATQFLGLINKTKPNGIQFLSLVGDKSKISAAQFQANISKSKLSAIQFFAEVNTGKSEAIQFLSEILDKKQMRGIQALSQIAKQNGYGFQTLVQISSDKSEAFQHFVEILASGKANGLQFETQIDSDRPLAVEFRKDPYQSFPITGYLEDEYLGTPYLTGYFGPRIPFQFKVDVTNTGHANGFQFEAEILDKKKTVAAQFLAQIEDKKHTNAIQFKVISTQGKPIGAQFQAFIEDALISHGFQFKGIMNKDKAYGFQYNSITTKAWGFQFLATVYNTKYLRVLHLFKSRGLTNTNWTATSTAIGDYDVNNLDTDIVEQVWRSGNGEKTNIKLTCDVGLNQICYMDTLAILNHNLTAGATITMSMSNDPLFASGVETVIVKSRRYDTYYIAPELPTNGYRYFRLEISDPTGPDDYLQIGCVIFGQSDIIQGENFTDEVDFEMQDFADTINTEAFTNVSNSRALKRKITLNFQNLAYEKRNYQILRNVFETYRTTHKCLWIPTPDVLDNNKNDRLRIFGKLSAMPKERHNNKGTNADYVSFTIELDESL